MIRLAAFSIFSFLAFAVFGQSTCLPEDISFTSQIQIDNFQTNYPGCDTISGDVMIQGSDIVNLQGLITLISINGTLCIKKNPLLAKLAGLDSLAYVRNLMIINNDSLENLKGLESLTSIDGYLHVWYNDRLIDLSGLSHITSISSDLMIEGNHVQVNCHGMESLEEVGGCMVIGCIAGWMHHNRRIKSLSGFDNLVKVGGLLWINCNDSLTNLSGLEHLETVGDGLAINDNKCLLDLTGLENLSSMGGRLIVGGWGEDCNGNQALTSLRGIENICEGSITELRIRNNPVLTSCDVKCICDLIVAQNATVLIADNAPGCNGVNEVKKNCESFDVTEKSDPQCISIHPNPCNNAKISINIDRFYPRLSLCCVSSDCQVVYTGDLVRKNTTIDVSNWHAGIYIAVIHSEGRFLGRKKFIIQ